MFGILTELPPEAIKSPQRSLILLQTMLLSQQFVLKPILLISKHGKKPLVALQKYSLDVNYLDKLIVLIGGMQAFPTGTKTNGPVVIQCVLGLAQSATAFVIVPSPLSPVLSQLGKMPLVDGIMFPFLPTHQAPKALRCLSIPVLVPNPVVTLQLDGPRLQTVPIRSMASKSVYILQVHQSRMDQPAHLQCLVQTKPRS